MFKIERIVTKQAGINDSYNIIRGAKTDYIVNCYDIIENDVKYPLQILLY